MKNIFLVLLAAMVIGTAGSSGQGANANPSTDAFGLGLMLGSMDSITGKYWFSGREAVDFGVGVINSPWTVLYADYLWHVPGMFGKGSKFGREAVGYFGGGAGLGFWSNSNDCGRWGCDWDGRHTGSGTALFARGLFGFEWYPGRSKWGIFAEIGPSILLTPGTGSTLDIGLGGRYYF